MDDDPQALEIIFRVLHHRYEEININLLDLVLVAEICEKYFLHAALIPALRDRCQRCLILAENQAPLGREYLILIAWTFGLKAEFQKASMDLLN